MNLWPWGRERRARQRLETSLPAVIRINRLKAVDQSTAPQKGRIVNFHRHGCCLALERLDMGEFHLARCLEEPDDYLIELSVFPPKGVVMELSAKAIWINRDLDQPGGEFQVGLEFTAPAALPADWRKQVNLG